MALAVAKSRGVSGIPASLPLLVDATPRAFLSWGSTLLHDLSSTSPPSYYRRLLSWGFVSPTAHQAPEIHGPCSFPLGLPDRFYPCGLLRSGFCRWFPTHQLRYRLGFPNLLAVSSLRCRPTIFRRVTLMGFRPSRVFPDTQTRAAHRRRHALLTLLPRSNASVLSGSFFGHVPLPRSQRTRLSSSSGPSSACQLVQFVSHG